MALGPAGELLVADTGNNRVLVWDGDPGSSAEASAVLPPPGAQRVQSLERPSAVLLGPDHVISQLSWFFSKLAMVTFGGAYAVLAYMGQDVVTRYGWLETAQMMDGLGLAETTPGPLILVTEFVGYVAAFQHAGGASIGRGLGGALVALLATLAPCFLWRLSGAPSCQSSRGATLFG